jgi:hypothetical protein
LLKHISTKVENGTLIITSDENIDSAEKRLVRVKMPIIDGLASESGSSLKTNNVIKGTKLIVSSESGSELDANVEYEEIVSSSESGSSLTLSGKALQLKTNSESGSQTDAKILLANEVISEASSGSTTEVHPIVKITAEASSGSSIQYEGEPKTVEKTENSGGSVSKN